MTSNGNVGRRRRKRDLNSTDIASEWLWKKKKKQEKRTLSSLSTLSRPHWSSSRFKGCRVLACHDHATNNSFVLCTNNPCIFVNCGIFLQNIQIRYFWSNKLKFARFGIFKFWADDNVVGYYPCKGSKEIMFYVGIYYWDLRRPS